MATMLILKGGVHGFSTRSQPTVWEKVAATQARLMAFPSDAKDKRNAVRKSAAVIQEARAHWADHCAVCHGNNGRGQTEMGKNMYPPAPDMRNRDTQDLTDGELFYIIENGVRLTGMPAWGDGSERSKEDSWKLVCFIRHLPALSDKEIEAMEKLNPKSPGRMAGGKRRRAVFEGAVLFERRPGIKQHQH